MIKRMPSCSLLGLCQGHARQGWSDGAISIHSGACPKLLAMANMDMAKSVVNVEASKLLNALYYSLAGDNVGLRKQQCWGLRARCLLEQHSALQRTRVSPSICCNSCPVAIGPVLPKPVD